MSNKTAGDWAALSLVFGRLRTFLDGMESTLGVVDFVSENAATLDSVETSIARHGFKRYPGIPMETHRRVADMLHPAIHERMDREDSLASGGATPEEIKAYELEWARELRDKFFDITGDYADYYRYMPIWGRARKSFRRSTLIANSLLMATVSEFEVLVSGLVRAALEIRPEIIRSSGQTYTIRDLEPFADLEEFRAHTREVMADGLLRGGFDEWMEWFCKQGIHVEGVTADASVLVEIFQRRHLLVHNGGVVNKFYLAKTTFADASARPALGSRIGVSRAYISKAVDELTVAATKLAAALLWKFAPTDDERRHISHRLDNVSYDLLCARRWLVVERIDDWHGGITLEEMSRLLAQVNRWTAMKRRKGLEAVRGEVLAWETATLAGKFKLAKLALLDEHESAYEIVRSALGTDDLPVSGWREWPVLEDLRAWELTNVDAADRVSVAEAGYEHGDGH